MKEQQPEEVSLEEQAEAFKAWRNGKDVEYWCSADRKWLNQATTVPVYQHYILRRKPQPKLRPWKPEEVPVGALIRRKNQPLTAGVILSLDSQNVPNDDSVLWPGRRGKWLSESFEYCLDYNEYSIDGGVSWLPCGVEE